MIARLRKKLYDRAAGVHPHVRPWHAQWLSSSILYRDLREVLPGLSGRLLDVGCGEKPYEPWMPNTIEHVGLDVEPGDKTDVVAVRGEPWPFPDAHFDSAICLQVVEHAADLEHVLSELARVLRPGGRLVVSAPFVYTEHADPDDYRRFSRHGLRALLSEHFDVLEVRSQGGVGSTAGVMLLNFVELSCYRSRVLLALFSVALPLWLATCAVVNLVGWLLDRTDRTEACYGNVLAVASRPLR